MTDTAADDLHTERLDRRRDAITSAARALFLEQGYEQTTLADVVTHAGGSLATLYKLFGNKEGLLFAVMRGQAESGADIVARAAAANLPPLASLLSIGEQLHERFLHPSNMALLRVVITRSIKDPEFARSFYEKTMEKTRGELECLFAKWQIEGFKFSGTAQDLSETFLALMVYDFQIAAIAHCPRQSLDPQHLKQRIGFFCRGAGLVQ